MLLLTPEPASIGIECDREHRTDEQRRRLLGPFEASVARTQKPTIRRQQQVVRLDRIHGQRNGAAHDPPRIRGKPGVAAVP
jgi:hypothetical protein